MATTAELQSWLDEARIAYRALVMGKAAVEFRDSDGSSVRYTSANASRLLAYIKDLESQLSGCAAKARLPLRPIWG
ncbi:gpW family head-tail joining protein [Manganibacter manganicus]|uniref:Phage tail protein n=1 Tax=Manganibacter manganicus TaxID=1873176 RepID=A0A1V8RRH9_9HYPH|nr:gpW family head-tail joining protein [Pseudaminobacter manganicus]OQM75589.1 hypothetical protein BFN67_17605 [Pseudaminobacter manganicus]